MKIKKIKGLPQSKIAIVQLGSIAEYKTPVVPIGRCKRWLTQERLHRADIAYVWHTNEGDTTYVQLNDHAKAAYEHCGKWYTYNPITSVPSVLGTLGDVLEVEEDKTYVQIVAIDVERIGKEWWWVYAIKIAQKPSPPFTFEKAVEYLTQLSELNERFALCDKATIVGGKHIRYQTMDFHEFMSEINTTIKNFKN